MTVKRSNSTVLSLVCTPIILAPKYEAFPSLQTEYCTSTWRTKHPQTMSQTAFHQCAERFRHHHVNIIWAALAEQHAKSSCRRQLTATNTILNTNITKRKNKSHNSEQQHAYHMTQDTFYTTDARSIFYLPTKWRDKPTVWATDTPIIRNVRGCVLKCGTCMTESEPTERGQRSGNQQQMKTVSRRKRPR